MAGIPNPGSWPILKTWKKKIMKLDRMSMYDCTPNAIVFVAGTAVAAFNVFWAIAGPECIDSNWDRINKNKAKHRKFKTNGTVFGPSIEPGAGKAGITAIRLGNIAQHIGFAMGIVDGILDGAFYGASLMRRYTGCTNVGAPYAELDMAGTVPALLPAGTFIVNTWVRQADFKFVGGPTGISVTGPITDLVTAAYGLSQGFNEFPPLEDCSFTSELIWLPSGNPVRQNWSGFGHSVNGTGVFYGQDVLREPGDSQLAVRVTKTEGVMFLTSAFFTASGGSATPFEPYKCGKALNDVLP